MSDLTDDELDEFEWEARFAASLERIKPYLGHPDYRLICVKHDDAAIYETMGFVVHCDTVVMPKDYGNDS